MEANKRMLRMRHWGGCYFKWKILIPGGTTNRYNENLKRPWYCRLPCWKQLHGEGKTTRKTLNLMYWTNRANRKRPFVICLYILSVCVWGGGACHCFSSFKNVYGLRVYGYTAAAKSATALQERTLAGRVFHSAGPRKNGRRVPVFVLASGRMSPALA